MKPTQQVIYSLIKLHSKISGPDLSCKDTKFKLNTCTVESETVNDVHRMSERDICKIQQRFETERATNDSISTMRRDSNL